MKLTKTFVVLTALLMCALPPAFGADKTPMLLGMDAVIREGSATQDELLPLYEKTAATAILVQGIVRQICVKQATKDQPASFTYDFSEFDSQPFLKSKKTKICRIDRSDCTPASLTSLDSDREEESSLLMQCCAFELAKHANKKGITVFWVSLTGFQSKGSTYWDLFIRKHLAPMYKGIKAASSANIVIAGGAGGNETSIKDLFTAGGKHLFDWFAVSCGQNSSDLVKIHSFLTENGLSDKKLFISRWGIGSQGNEKEIREFVREGYRIITTKTETYDPEWIAGAFYFLMNDYQQPLGGMVITENTKTNPTIKYGGGLIDIDGKPKGDLLDIIYKPQP